MQHFGAGVAHGFVGVEINFFVLGTPETFDEYVVHPASFAVHTDVVYDSLPGFNSVNTAFPLVASVHFI